MFPKQALRTRYGAENGEDPGLSMKPVLQTFSGFYLSVGVVFMLRCHRCLGGCKNSENMRTSQLSSLSFNTRSTA